MSSQQGSESAANSNFIVDTIIKLLNIDASYSEIISTIIRKGAHFTEYFILSSLVTLTVKEFMCNKINFALVLLLCLLEANCDEFLQGFIAGRSSEVRDVLIDFSGALLFVVIYNIVRRYFVKKHKLYNY